MYDNKQAYYPNQPQTMTAVQPGIIVAEPAQYNYLHFLSDISNFN